MTQEEKDLLLKDLCARVPYHVKILNISLHDGTEDSIEEVISIDDRFICTKIDHGKYNKLVLTTYNIKPLLYPLSSMTEEQLYELKEYSGLKYSASLLELVSWANTYSTLEFWLEETPSYVVIKVFDWLNEHHFDYRNLITRGLALDASNLNIY